VAARQAHLKAFNEEPGAFFDNAYTAMLALTNAIAHAGTTDSDAIAKILKSEDVATPFGKIHFDEKGDAIGVGFSMYQVRDGVYVQVQ
jgi:branched-chain amino acid transport system substrate-binding protein